MIERLAPYYEAAERESREREQDVPLSDLEWIIREQEPRDRSFTEALNSTTDVAVIAEHKRKSPSEGEIRPGSDVFWTVDQYKKGGALAVSILTQGEHFGGRIEDITAARHASDLPILRKDFISREYELYEAKALGADAALLIVGGLKPGRLFDLYEEASDIGLECLVEVHTDSELDRAAEIGANLIGINNRNLDTLKVSLDTTRYLISQVPDYSTVVAESGYSVRNPEHIEVLRRIGADAVLMGTALMREEVPCQALRTWLDPQ